MSQPKQKRPALANHYGEEILAYGCRRCNDSGSRDVDVGGCAMLVCCEFCVAGMVEYAKLAREMARSCQKDLSEWLPPSVAEYLRGLDAHTTSAVGAAL